MRQYFTIIGLICLLNANAQTQPTIESLKKENAKLKEQVQILKSDTFILREKIRTCDLYNKNYDYTITNTGRLVFKFVSCNYNFKTKKVRIEFVLLNRFSDKNVLLNDNDSEAYDELGNKYYSSIFQKEKIGKEDTHAFNLISDTPVNGFIEFPDVLSGIDIFKLIKIKYSVAGDNYYDPYEIEIRNLKITK